MSFNIRYGTARDGKNSWKYRRPFLKKALEESGPDIIATQEALRFQLDEIRADLDHYGEIGVGRENGKQSGEYAAILYNRSRFRVRESGTFWFSETPDKPGSADWGNRSPRICTWAMFKVKKSGRVFYVYNVHLDHRSHRSRERSVRLLIRKIVERRCLYPVIIAGDFNTGEQNSVIKYLNGKDFFDTDKKLCPINFVDTYRRVHPRSPGGTFNLFRGFRFGPRIDFIFAESDLQVISAQIIRNSFNGRYPSDHFPVTATLKFS